MDTDLETTKGTLCHHHGGLPDPQGVTTIDKVNPIYQTAGDDSTPVVGYDIVTSVVQTTTSDPVSYDVDLATGELTAR